MNNQSTWTQNPKFILSVNQPTKVLIILSQVIPTAEAKPKDLLAIGFYVFKKEGGEGTHRLCVCAHVPHEANIISVLF